MRVLLYNLAGELLYTLDVLAPMSLAEAGLSNDYRVLRSDGHAISPRMFWLALTVEEMRLLLFRVFSFRVYRYVAPGVYGHGYHSERQVNRQFKETSVSLCEFMEFRPFHIEGYSFDASIFVAAYLRTV